MSTAVWRRTPSTLFRRTTTGVVLLPDAAVDPVELAGAAALVWDLLEEPTSLATAVDLLAEACGEQTDRIGPDVVAILDQLQELGAAESGSPAC